MASKNAVVEEGLFELEETDDVDVNGLEIADDFDDLIDTTPEPPKAEKPKAKAKAKPKAEPVEEVEEFDMFTEESEDFEDDIDDATASKGSISDLITDIDDSVEFVTWVIYGKNGTGKTTLLSTTDGVLVLASEDGTLSIKDKSKGKAKKLRVDTWEKLEAVYWLLAQSPVVKDKKTGKPIGIKIKVKGGEFLVRTVAFDTVDRLVDVCMRNVVLGVKDRDPDKDVLKKTLKNWGDMSDKMKFWLQQFEELPVQRVLLCQESSNSEDVESEEFSIYPALNKSLRAYVLSEADIIARTYIYKSEKGTEFRMSAKPNPKFVTKDRTTKLSGVVVNPSLDKLYNTVFK